MKFFTEQIQNINNELNSKSKPHVLYLSGPLGAGKTTFVQEFMSYLSYKDHNVQSPTFLKLLNYKIQTPVPLNILHMDAYRIEDSEEIEKMSLDSYGEIDYFFIEWPDVFDLFLKTNPYLLQSLGIQDILNVEIAVKSDQRFLTYNWKN